MVFFFLVFFERMLKGLLKRDQTVLLARDNI